MEELLTNNTEEMTEDVLKVVEDLPVETSNFGVKIGVAAGVITLVGLGVYAYRKHKSNKEKNEEETGKSRKFVIFKKTQDFDVEEEDSEEN